MLFHKTFILLLTILHLQQLCRGDIASRLEKRYHVTRIECVTFFGKAPAYVCSGIMIRGINANSDLKHAWSLKSRNKDKNSFAMAYLRQDTRFKRFPRDYDAGFIIYPYLSTPTGKHLRKVYCAFPLDAHTDDRSGEHACGQSNSDRFGTSKHCDEQGITSFPDWFKHYVRTTRFGGNFVTNQCAFDMTKSSAAQNFAVFLLSNMFLRLFSEYSLRNNELLVQGWDEEEPQNIPIEAFFYLLDKDGASAKAEAYQADFYKETGEIVPIVGIRLANEANGIDFSVSNHKGFTERLIEQVFRYRPSRMHKT